MTTVATNWTDQEGFWRTVSQLSLCQREINEYNQMLNLPLNTELPLVTASNTGGTPAQAQPATVEEL